MLKSLTDDLEEGEIYDDEETDGNQFNVGEDSSVLINERTKFLSLYHASDNSQRSSNNSEIFYHSVIYPQINEEDNLQANKGEEEENGTKKDKSKDFYDYETNEKDDEEYFLDHKVAINENESEDEFKVANFQDELIEYQSNLDDESDDDDNEFSDEIVCSEGIITVNEFHSKLAALPVDTEDRTNKNTIEHVDEMPVNLAEEVAVNDSWIFHSLDEPSRIVMQGNEAMDSHMLPESEGNLEERLAEMDLSKFEVIIDVTVSGYLNCRFFDVTGHHPSGNAKTVDVVTNEKQLLHKGSNNQIEQIAELERKFTEEKENYVRNMYSLLVTARTQIAALRTANRKLEMKLERNCTMKCPKCEHEICIKNNLLKPKYIKVLRGRCGIEMLFDHLAIMEEWLTANYLDINPDGLPVVLEIPRTPTLASTKSLLTPKANSIRDIRRNMDEATPISSNDCRNPESIYSIAMRQDMQSTNAANNFNNHSTKQCEILNHVTQDGKAREKSSSRNAYEPVKYEEQQRHRILCTYISPDRSFDYGHRRHFNSPKSLGFHGSRQNLNVSMSHCDVTEQEHPHTITNNVGN